jgi:hypothetical protein
LRKGGASQKVRIQGHAKKKDFFVIKRPPIFYAIFPDAATHMQQSPGIDGNIKPTWERILLLSKSGKLQMIMS